MTAAVFVCTQVVIFGLVRVTELTQCQLCGSRYCVVILIVLKHGWMLNEWQWEHGKMSFYKMDWLVQTRTTVRCGRWSGNETSTRNVCMYLGMSPALDTRRACTKITHSFPHYIFYGSEQTAAKTLDSRRIVKKTCVSTRSSMNKWST